MKVKGDLKPGNPFTLEHQPKRPGFVLVRFYENPVPYEETMDGFTVSGWEYDEYHLELADTGSLPVDVANNFAAFLAQAKAEDRKKSGDMESRVSTLEETAASKDDVQSVWDQMAEAYSEGVQEA